MDTCERCTAVNEFVQQDTKGPDVECVVVRLVHYHFWRHVLEGAAVGVSWLLHISLDTPTKVADFDDISLLDENILWLDVSVDEPLLVHVVDATADLDEEVESNILLQKLLFTNQVEQIAFVSILES